MDCPHLVGYFAIFWTVFRLSQWIGVAIPCRNNPGGTKMPSKVAGGHPLSISLLTVPNTRPWGHLNIEALVLHGMVSQVGHFSLSTSYFLVDTDLWKFPLEFTSPWWYLIFHSCCPGVRAWLSLLYQASDPQSWLQYSLITPSNASESAWQLPSSHSHWDCICSMLPLCTAFYSILFTCIWSI